MPGWFSRNFGPILFVGFGLIFGGVGAVLLWISWSTGLGVGQLEAVPPLTIERLPTLEAGQLVVVEGRISERNTVAYDTLVIFTASRYGGLNCNDNDNCHQVWTEVERVTPAIWLDLPGGRVQVSNTDYALYNPPETWQTTLFLIEDETLEYRGYRLGSPVFVAGVINTAAGPTLHADFLFGGSRADYLAAERTSATVLLFLGLIFGAFGLLFGIIGGVWFFKR